MKHHAGALFWQAYAKLPKAFQNAANKNFALLKTDPRHPSLHLKRIGRYWSVRAGLSCRALAVEVEDGLLWFWIGSHADYDARLRE